ncbi:hypothetical protein FISHEDRAFT_65554 [Fistulina hepatica ATCC 64428]|uniref:Protein CASP n=1 Tax=Fistulina hepatica ATCC 64428 TaxID=1128425 RepID=A0A0D7AE11_9AGAR|nr:hypothetical protein FISHEDRAFT_65554 [Fistulina hepatica ATCC 64428]
MADSEHNFSDALATWRAINLSELQKTLDAQGLELVDNQKESVVGRKALADKTKEFKKIPESEKNAAFKGLLKAYQAEIDNLTKRSKASESAFLNVYKVFAEAPDPYPLLEAAVDQTVKVSEAREMAAELARLREENSELKQRVNETPTIEAARTRAEEKAQQLENKMIDLVQEKVSQKENELNATYDERLRNYEEREKDLQNRVALAKNQLRDLRMSNDTNQARLLDQSQRQDQEVVAKLAEVDMIVADLERANSRVATVERRNEILRAEIENLRSGSESSNRVKTLEDQIADLESETERLSKALNSQKQVVADMERAAAKANDDSARELQRKIDEINQLKYRLRQYADYDEIKRELEIIKYVEFAGMDDDDADDDGESIATNESIVRMPDPNAEKANAHHGRSLEALLAAKNRKIQEELTKFRVIHGELEASLQATESQVVSLTTELDKQKELNEKLENDLLEMNQPTASVNGMSTPLDGEGPGNGLTGLDLGGKKLQDGSVRTTPIPFASSADTSILPIVTSQRDRFRQRNAELEEEMRKQYQIITELRSEVKTLQVDNLKLYEKVRYMQSYREENTPARPVTSQLNPLPSSGPEQRVDINKYQARYEEAINPFEAFRGREATRAYESLNRIERGVLVLTRGILGNRRTRTFFIIYALALHLLVLFTTYECTVSSGSTVAVPKKPRI